MGIKYVIFDVGGVCYPYSLNPLDEWALENSKDKETLIEKGGVKSFDYNPYMKGQVDFEEFCKQLCEHCLVDYNKNLKAVINKKLHKGVGEFFAETLEVMNEIKKRGIKVGLLSNALPCLEDTADCLVEKEFCFVSYELGCLKPDKEIYLKLVDKLSCKPEDIIFVDDKEKNVESAKKLGIKGVVYNKETIKKEVFSIINLCDGKNLKNVLEM